MASRIPPFFALVALVLACSTPPERRSDIAASPPSDRVVVAPLNLALRIPAELSGKGEPVWQELLGYLHERDRQIDVLAPVSAERLWLEATADLDRTDRRAALRSAYSHFARELARHRDFDVLVVPSLLMRPGHLSGSHAHWDGVQRELPNTAALADAGLGELLSSGIRVAGLSGKVAAASLHLVLLSADGSWLHDGLGGLVLLQELQRDNAPGGALAFATREAPFADRESLREGVVRAFEGPVLTAGRR